MLAAVRWASTGAAVLVLLLWIANLPFYAGAPVGDSYAWRMEHGRVRVTRRPGAATRRGSFYVASNSEGLRWGWEWRREASEGWMVNVPLWAPFAVLAAVAAFSTRAHRRRRREES